ncbi:hypothetical protein IAT38_008272 [Cryptococcus sp. DSM 104549]
MEGQRMGSCLRVGEGVEVVACPPPPLPTPRRIIAAHNPDGTPFLSTEPFPFPSPDDLTLRAQVGYVQPDLVGEPSKAIEWAGYRAKKISHDDVISFRWLDIPPKYKGDLHFTKTFDYLILTHGEAELFLHDGTTQSVRQGDVVIQIANIHAWNNPSSEWARFVGVITPAKAVEVNGQGLEAEPFFGYHAQF